MHRFIFIFTGQHMGLRLGLSNMNMSTLLYRWKSMLNIQSNFIYVFIHLYMYVCMYEYIFACVYVCTMYVYMYECMNVYMCIHVLNRCV